MDDDEDGSGDGRGSGGSRSSTDDAPPDGARERVDGDPPDPGVWKRWVDHEDNLHLHQFTEIRPRVGRRGSPPYVEFLPEGDAPPTFEDPDTGERREFVFVGGITRQILRHTPLVVLLATLVLLVGGELSPSVAGVSELIPTLDRRLLVLVVWVALAPFLVYLLSRVDVLGTGDGSITGMASVYALPLVLLGGVAVSIVLVLSTETPGTLAPNVVFVSGYLLTLLVGGQLFYDTVLRTENLFVNLPDTQIVRDEDRYYRLLADMSDSLSATAFGLPVALFFGVIFAAQFGGLWTLSGGPQQLGFGLNVAVNTLLNVVLIMATFQFVVVIRYLNRMLADGGEYSRVLGYEPFHVDGRGGYRDVGRFAIRFNVLVGLGALFLVYRLYVTGSRALPAAGLDGFVETFDLVLWLVDFVGPLLVFGVVLAVWVYLGFWSMHMKMVREKIRTAWAFQGRPGMDGDAGAGVPISAMDHGPAYQYVADAPEWPVNPQRLTGIITGTFIPLLVPLPGILL